MMGAVFDYNSIRGFKVSCADPFLKNAAVDFTASTVSGQTGYAGTGAATGLFENKGSIDAAMNEFICGFAMDVG